MRVSQSLAVSSCAAAIVLLERQSYRSGVSTKFFQAPAPVPAEAPAPAEQPVDSEKPETAQDNAAPAQEPAADGSPSAESAPEQK